MDCAQLANTTASGLVALCSLVFGVVYHRHAPWRTTHVGRHLMLFTIAIGALGAYTVAVTIWNDGLPAALLRVTRTLLLLLIAALILQRTRMVLRAQHEGVPHTADPDQHDPHD